MSNKVEFDSSTVLVESGCEEGVAWARDALAAVVPVVAWESAGSDSLDGFLKRRLKILLIPILR